MERYNLILDQTSKEYNVPMIKISNQLEKDTTTFYDDCHFNESGARKVSEILAKYLIGSGILDYTL